MTRLVLTRSQTGATAEGTGRITGCRGLIPTSDLQQWWPQRDSDPCLTGRRAGNRNAATGGGLLESAPDEE